MTVVQTNARNVFCKDFRKQKALKRAEPSGRS